MKQFFAFCLAFFVALSLIPIAPVSAATVWEVSPGDDVQDAIDSASEGDIILLLEGEHDGPVVLDKPLTLRGEEGAILSGGDPVVTVEANHVVVEDLTIVGDGSITVLLDNTEIYDENEQLYFTLQRCVIKPADDEVGVQICDDSSNFYYGNVQILDNVIGTDETPTDEAIYLRRNIEHSIIEIRGNEIINSDRGIRVRSEIVDTELIIEDNSFDILYDYGILMDYIEDGSLLRIARNTFSSSTAGGADEGIRFRGDNEDSTIEIVDNTISNFEYGIEIDYGLYNMEVEISGNTIEDVEEGIIFDDHVYNSSVELADNTISAEYFGINFDDELESSTLALLENTVEMQGNGIGLYVDEIVDDLDMMIAHNSFSDGEIGAYFDQIADDEAVSLTIVLNNFYGNEDGLWFYIVSLTNEDSEIAVGGNNFADNDYGLVFEDVATPGKLEIRVNSFTLNGYGLYSYMTEDVNATLNWWGSEDGPTLPNPGGDGDEISAGVVYDPWLASLDVEVEIDGSDVTVTATLLNNDGEIVGASGLWVAFNVTGTNTHTEEIEMTGGVAVLEYSSEAEGEDEIDAVMLFANEDTGLAAEASSPVEAPAEEIPETSGFTAIGFVGLLLAAAGVLVIRRYMLAA